jgi:hypothetical protein
VQGLGRARRRGGRGRVGGQGLAGQGGDSQSSRELNGEAPVSGHDQVSRIFEIRCPAPGQGVQVKLKQHLHVRFLTGPVAIVRDGEIAAKTSELGRFPQN